MLEEKLEELVSVIDNMDLNPDNSFGVTLGDQVFEMCYHVKRIADVLEKIESKMK